MTKGLDEIDVEVCFVLPTTVPLDATSHVELRTPANIPAGARGLGEEISSLFQHVELHKVAALLSPYGRPATHEQVVKRLLEQKRELGLTETEIEALAKAEVPVGAFGTRGLEPGAGAHYAGDLMAQVNRYARLAVEIARREQFDVVHAHDWMTYPAGQAVAAATRRPLLVHVHSTEFDRSGEDVDQRIYDIERTGMHVADKVICVSYLTRNIVINRYGVQPQKVEVVYNAVNLPSNTDLQMKPIEHNEKIVLFLGRVTMQKGPEYFLRAAKKVIEKFGKVRFVMAGSGDMITECISEAASLGIGGYVTFTGFLRGGDVDKIFSMADLYVMPSVSEPFGIAPLEAISHNVPVIISKQSGVSEVLSHVLKVDFWDIDEMANKILAVLRHKPLHKTLRQHGQIELRKFSWRDSAVKLRDLYTSLVTASG
jgi:glycosyltransferase involved in cell wall biosynthesis